MQFSKSTKKSPVKKIGLVLGILFLALALITIFVPPARSWVTSVCERCKDAPSVVVEHYYSALPVGGALKKLLGPAVAQYLGTCVETSGKNGVANSAELKALQATKEVPFQDWALVQAASVDETTYKIFCFKPGSGPVAVEMWAGSLVRLNRRFSRPISAELQGGSMQINARDLNFTLVIGGKDLDLQAKGPVTLMVVRNTEATSLYVKAGRLDLVRSKDFMRAEKAEAISLSIWEGASLSLDGQLLLNGQKRAGTLLPSGFVGQ